MFMKVEAAPTLFLITVLAFVVLIAQIGAGGGSATQERSGASGQPPLGLIESLISDSSADKGATAQVALLRTPIALEQPDLPQR